ncbi:hypothetical protein LCGC14_2449940 [marine sediment metagenome]|uniref:Resolvase HTH domain-containing protein n=1 Tax=marine sediment metagenome TaxID=412755 RepID=A0A0F9BGG7_9ZZZZ
MVIKIGNRPNENLDLIKEDFKKKTSIKAIARKYNISRSHVYNLRARWEDDDL